ncbi:MAG: sensor domain-containing diguanylate cyclase [Thermotogae bacterium]|nr:sensor domain-containing diguanylate cyclase [Thermotogota bacterium]
MSIGKRIILFFSIISALLVALILLMSNRLDLQQELTDAQRNRYDSYRLAVHLKSTVDELSRMARTYTLTADPRYKEYYRHILAIRNGKEPRPPNYSLLFWDLFTEENEFHPLKTGNKISDEELLKKAKITPDEMKLLSIAQRYSNDLITLEEKAFHLMDLASINDSLSAINRSTAQQLLHGAEYHRLKALFSQVLSRFFDEVDRRTSARIDRINHQSRQVDQLMMVLALLLLIVALVSWHYSRTQIIDPLKQLTRWTERLKAGEFNLPDLPRRKDEIGQLSQSFYTMAKTIHAHMDDLTLKAHTDSLTGLPNRMALEDQMDKAMEEIRSQHSMYYLALLDLDRFKSINDRYGHLVGDQVLIEFARLLEELVNPPHIVGRWGGEEFLVLLKVESLYEAQKFCETVRKKVENRPFAHDLSITVSIGLAKIDQNRGVKEALLRADQALYRAKASGRNRLEVGGEEAEI